MNEINNNIIIDLSRSTYPNINHDSSNELIQQKAIIDIKVLMDKMLKIVRKPEPYNPLLNNEEKEGEHFRRRHEAITILGERGTGKTNFLINLKNILHERKYNGLVFLKTLDPTLFEDRQNILIAIISMIHLKVEKEYRDSKCEENVYTDWRKTLSGLAEGLNLLDGIGHNPMENDLWDDAKIILDKGLSAAHSGYSFEKKFHIFIYKSLKILKKEMFILRLDDIDTNIEKGWPALEVIRKYLTTPHLQVIISGDWKLYSKIVRIKQWSQLEKLHTVENKNLIPTIDSLEEQYLSKILKPSNRIFLKSIKSIVLGTKKIKYDIIVVDKEKDVEKNINDVYREIFEQVFSFPDSYIETYSHLLMSLPIRTNIQTLTTYVKSLDGNKINKKDFIEGVINTFLTVSERSGFSYKDFQEIYEPIGYTFLATRLHRNELVNNIKSLDILSMEPSFENNDINLFMMLLGSVIVDTLNEYPNRIIDWFYRIEYLELIKKSTTENIDTIMQYLDYKKRISVFENVIKLNGLLHSNSKVSGFAKFYVHQRQVPKKSGAKLAYNDIIKRIHNELYSDIDKENKLIIFLLSIVTKKVIVKKESSTNLYTSFHYLLGLLGRSLVGKSSAETLVKISDDTKIFALSEKNKDSFVFHGQNIFDKNELDSLPLSKELDRWVENKKYLDSTSLIMLRNIWKEFISSEESMDNCTTLQEYLEVQLYIFLNSLLKAEAKEKRKSTSYENIYNKAKAKRYFLNNLLKFRGKKRVSGNNKDHQIIRSIIDDIYKKINENISISLLEYFIICPLWDYYVNYSKPKEISTKQAIIDMGDLGGKYYYSIFETIALHTEGKSSESSHQPNLTFKQIATQVIQEHIDAINRDDLKKSLEELIKEDEHFKNSKFRWGERKLKDAVSIFNSMIS